MFEAVIQFEGGRIHRVEAGSFDILKCKCNPFVKKDNVVVIHVYKKEYVGSIKHPLIKDANLLK